MFYDCIWMQDFYVKKLPIFDICISVKLKHLCNEIATVKSIFNGYWNDNSVLGKTNIFTQQIYCIKIYRIAYVRVYNVQSNALE